MALWRRFWLLFSVIWLVVALLHAGSLLLADDDPDQERIQVILIAAFVVPAASFLVGWLLERWRKRR